MPREEDKMIGQIDSKIVRAKRRKRDFDLGAKYKKPSTIRFWRHPILETLWGLNDEVRAQELADKILAEDEQW